MAVSFSLHSKKLALCLLVLFCIGTTDALSQSLLSGNFNQPKSHVVAFPASDIIRVTDETGFVVGDTVLLIQMQGVMIITDPGTYGTLQDTIGAPGLHEFLIIQSINAGANEIEFKNNILNSYDVKGNVQVIKAPYYNSARVTGDLTVDNWNPATGTGGVLTMIVGRKLELSANINLTGTGFKGGNYSVGTADCTFGAYASEFYNLPYVFAGFKGEGVALHDDSRTLLSSFAVKGKGPNYTGGGGGNGRFSGGGGGGNRGKGGKGGDMDCFPTTDEGKGGFEAAEVAITDGIFFGGGGGGATSSAAGLSAPGGNGGGIVIIVTDSLVSSGGNIIVDGGDGGNATGAAGSGGGGAGGSIALSLTGFGDFPLTLSVKGGDGGDNPGVFGEGGGGSGGLIFISKNKTSDILLDGGNPGNHPVSTASAGLPGKKKLLFKAKLNGFLFNSIRSSVTGDQVDSVCSNMIPPKITGTVPVGGTAPYTYKWEKSYDNFATAPILLVNDVVSVNYTPLAEEANTVWFRRTVTDAAMLTDVSKTVKMIVQPQIQNNIIGDDAIICFRQDPVKLVERAVLSAGNGKYTYNWQVRTGTDYFNPANLHTASEYTPLPQLEVTSWYRRTVTSGRCVDSTAIVKITVLDTIQKNRILSPPEDICFGMTFTPLTGTTTPTLAGGDNTFKFQWQYNINNAGWANASGDSTTINYDPVEYPERDPSNEYYYRRIVLSGTGDVCKDTSNLILLRDYHKIANNSISSSQVICSGETPVLLNGSSPQYGDGSRIYKWQDSTEVHSWADIAGANSINYQPPALTDTTRYRRIVFSSACSDISKSIIIAVHKPILNSGIAFLSGVPDSVICNGQTPHRLKGLLPTGGTDLGDYTYQWQYSTDNLNFNDVPSSGAGINYQPSALTNTTYFRRKTFSGSCQATSNSLKIDVLLQISNNVISPDQDICYNTLPLQLTGQALSGGNGSFTYLWEQSIDNGVTWITATGISSAAGYTPPPLTVKTQYRRTVFSGLGNCCVSISNVVNININPLPTGVIRNTADTTICGGLPVLLKLTLTGSGPWNVTFDENGTEKAPVAVAGSTDFISVIPPSPLANNSIIYTLGAVEDNNGCLATSLTGLKNVTVYKTPSPFAGNDTIVCGPTVRLRAFPSVGTGSWLLPPQVLSSTANSAVMTVTVDSVFSGGNVLYKFYWQETNVLCTQKDSVAVIFDKRIGPINAGPDTSIYSFDNIYYLLNDPVMPWETGTWTVLQGAGDFEAIPGGVTDISAGPNIYLWTVANGACSKSDQLNLSLYSLEIPEGFSPNNDPDGYNNTFVIKGLDLDNQLAELKIVNSAGAEVFSTCNINGQSWTDWDGTNSRGADLPEGTYYYILKLTSLGNNKVFKKSGFIILKRF